MRPLVAKHLVTIIQDDIVVAGMYFQVCRDFLSSSCRTVNITVNDGEQDGSNANNLVGEREGMPTKLGLSGSVKNSTVPGTS